MDDKIEIELYSKYEEAYRFEMNRKSDLPSHVSMVTPIIGGLVAALFYLIANIDSVQSVLTRLPTWTFIFSILAVFMQVILLIVAYNGDEYGYLNHPDEIEKYTKQLKDYKTKHEINELDVNRKVSDWYRENLVTHTSRNGKNNDRRQKLIWFSNFTLMVALVGTGVLTLIYSFALLTG